MYCGVGKSGSPAPTPITGRPAALRAWAFASTASVADSGIAPRRAETRRGDAEVTSSILAEGGRRDAGRLAIRVGARRGLDQGARGAYSSRSVVDARHAEPGAQEGGSAGSGRPVTGAPPEGGQARRVVPDGGARRCRSPAGVGWAPADPGDPVSTAGGRQVRRPTGPW